MNTECPSCHEKITIGDQPYTCTNCSCTWTETPSERKPTIKRIKILKEGTK